MSSTTMPTSSTAFPPPVQGDIIHSEISTYRVESLLGQGSFGKIVKCLRMEDLKQVTIKIMENTPLSIKAAIEEAFILNKLKQLDTDKCNLVRFHQGFNNGEVICLEFESSDQTLFDFMNERHFSPLNLQMIRSIVKQVGSALFHLKAIDVIHADLKLEHIMLVDLGSQPLWVKVSGFNLSHTSSVARAGKNIQSLPYRSPEVLLGLPYSTAIDVWSLGCIAASLYIGALVYPGKCPYEMLRYIDQCQGPLPARMLDSAQATHQYFNRDATTGSWKLKTPQEYFDTEKNPLQENTNTLTSLDSLLNLRPLYSATEMDKLAEAEDTCMFVDLLKGTLQLDGGHRLTPRQVLQHHFISMCHMASIHLYSDYAKSCIAEMNEGHKRGTPSGEEKVLCSFSKPRHCSVHFVHDKSSLSHFFPVEPRSLHPELDAVNPPAKRKRRGEQEIVTESADYKGERAELKHLTSSCTSSQNCSSHQGDKITPTETDEQEIDEGETLKEQITEILNECITEK